MPQRHSKNSGSATYGVFSYHERRQCEFMQKEQARLGVDSQLPFGYCHLSLQPAVDAVVTPSGRTYSREALLEHMASTTRDLKRKRQVWEAAQERKKAAKGDDDAKDATETEEAFERANDPLALAVVATTTTTTTTTTGTAGTTTTSAFVEAGKPDSNFWLPQRVPEAPAKDAPEPPKRPPSPVTGAPLRMKDLVALPLKRADSNKVGTTNDGRDVRFLCHVSGDEITTQPALFIRTTGCILLEAVASRLNVLHSKVCPLTGRAFKSKDVITLVTGTSAYAASGGADLVVKKYRATGGGA